MLQRRGLGSGDRPDPRLAEERRQLFAARAEQRRWQADLRAEARQLPYPPSPYNGDADRFFPMRHYLEEVDGRLMFQTVQLSTRVDRILMRNALVSSLTDPELAAFVRAKYILFYGR
jgi:hypothetical protein